MGKHKKGKEIELSRFISKEYFGLRFEAALKVWMERTKKTQSDLASLTNVSPNSITNWKQGRSFPTIGTWESLLKEFHKVGIDEEYFRPQTIEENYHYSEEYNRRTTNTVWAYAEYIGLDIDLLRGLKNLINFDAEYPLYLPITTDDKNKCFKRELADFGAAELPNENIFQMKIDNENVNMSMTDIEVLADIQDELIEYTRYLFYRRKQEMIQELQKANSLDFNEVSKPENKELLSNKLYEIDRYGKAYYLLGFIDGDQIDKLRKIGAHLLGYELEENEEE